MSNHERDRALMEGARNAACDDYFAARPQIDSIDRRRVYEAGFQAGAASRDAEIAELVGALGDVTAHLVAAHSLLSRGGKKAAASDTVFKIMLQDYEKSFEAGRKALAKVRKPTFFEAGRQSVIEGCDDGTIDWRGENEV